MLYSQFLLSRKGPLSTIWAAAFCFRKLKREEITRTDISSSIDKIIPDTEISYRVLAQLLLGIVRIFSKKVDYFYSDCNEALSSIRKSFSPGKCSLRRKTIMKPQRSTKETKGHKQKHNVVHTKEAISMEPEDPMWAPCDHIPLSIPERFELDSFVLDIPDDEDSVRPHTESSPLDILLDDSNTVQFMNESIEGGRFCNEDLPSACFTPVTDVLPYELLDIAFEITRNHNLSSTDKGEESIQGDKGCLDKGVEKEPGSVSMVDRESRDLLEPVKLRAARSNLEKHLTGDLVSDIPDHDLLDMVDGQNKVVKLTQIINDSPCRDDIGISSPKLTVRTPARKEPQHRLSKKRRLFDEAIVMSNKILRTGIHDASGLVSKRRKAPHTHLDAWRARRICSLRENFLEPLIPCMSSKVKSFSQSKFWRHTMEASAVELPIPFTEVPVEVGQSCNEETFEEPIPGIIEDPIPEFHYEDSRTHILHEKDAGNALSVEHSETESDSNNQAGLTDFGSFDGIRQGDGWSSRTRNVAKFLLSKFTDPQNPKGSLSLDRVLQGKTRAKCARLFYETLMLKCAECIDVEQDSPYSDIVLSATSKLKSTFESG